MARKPNNSITEINKKNKLRKEAEKLFDKPPLVIKLPGEIYQCQKIPFIEKYLNNSEYFIENEEFEKLILDLGLKPRHLMRIFQCNKNTIMNWRKATIPPHRVVIVLEMMKHIRDMI